MFVTQGPAEFAILGNALRTGDNELLMQTAHRLQGILSVLGADDQLKSICRSIVKTGRAQNWSEATGLIHQLEHLFAQCIQSAKLELAIMEEPAGQKKG
jgi:HPt (histidine-containing phosphotransfer) domain-containing protein